MWKEYQDQLAAEGKAPVKRSAPKPPVDKLQSNESDTDKAGEDEKDKSATNQIDHHPPEPLLLQEQKKRTEAEQQRVQLHETVQENVAEQQQVQQPLPRAEERLILKDNRTRNGNENNNQQPQEPHVEKEQQGESHPGPNPGQFSDYLGNKAKERNVADDVIPANVNVNRVGDDNQEKVKFEQGEVLEQPDVGMALPAQQGNEPNLQEVNAQLLDGKLALNDTDSAKKQIQPNKTVDDKDAYVQEGTFKSRKLNEIKIAEKDDSNSVADGFLPWERRGVFAELIKV